MHILFLSDNFPPEVNAPANRTYEHTREWVKLGHSVTVITCAPNFPHGRTYSGYTNKLWQVETVNNIRVIRVWTYMAPNEGFVKRLFDFLSFAIASFFASFFVRKVDVVIGTSPQFFTTVSAWLISKFKRIPYIFELRDLWPESIKAVGVLEDSWILDSFEKLELFLYRNAAAIISVTHSFKDNLILRGIVAEKIFTITNGVDLSEFFICSKDISLINHLSLQDKFVVGYVGTHGLAHSLDTILGAAEILQSSKKADDIHFIFVGDGAAKKELVKTANHLQLKNTTFLDSVSREQISRYWSILDISIVHLKKTDLFKTVIPSKMFECMAMGVPILHGVAGESAKIIEENKVGILVEPENPIAIAERLIAIKDDRELLARLGQNALEAKVKYDRKKLAIEMLDVIASTVKAQTEKRL